MNGINRRGQKVRCITEIEFVRPNGEAIEAPAPTLNEVYTVKDFVNLEPFFSEPDLHPGITLFDFPTFTAKFKDGRRIKGGWPIVAFRPLIEDKPSAEAEALLKLITDARELSPMDPRTAPVARLPPLPMCRCTEFPSVIFDAPWRFRR